MFVTRKMIETEGKRSPFIRRALVQSGDKLRVDALKQFLLSVGVCELTFKEAEALHCVIHRKKYRFMGNDIVFVFLDSGTFESFRRLTNAIELDVSFVRNGIVGIRNQAKKCR